MQTHPLMLTSAAPATSINIAGRAFRYIEGSSAGNARIIVKPENGNEMELKPGQGFKLADEAGRWFVKSLDGVSAITGTLNIGSGDFEDNNVQVSGTMAANATIVNTPTVNIAAGNKVQEEILAYTHSFTSSNSTGQNIAVEIISPGANTNGVIIQSALIVATTSQDHAFLAKSSAPTGTADGDCILFVSMGLTQGTTLQLPSRIRVPAGKGVYFIQNNANPSYKALTLTKL